MSRQSIVIGLLAFLLGAGGIAVNASAADTPFQTIKITREFAIPPVIGTNRTAGCLGGDSKIEATVDVREGVASGGGHLTYRMYDDKFEMQGAGEFRLSGTVKDGHVGVKLVSPDSIKMKLVRAPPPQTPGTNIIGSTEDYKISDLKIFTQYEGTLAGGRYDVTEKMPGCLEIPYATHMEVMSQLKVAVAAEHAIIPGHLRYFNAVTIKLDGVVDDPNGATVNVKLGAGDQGRLVESEGGAAAPTLRLTGF